MDWTAGYASDVEYTAGYYREQSPSLLNFACLLNGFEPIALDQPFTYFELGFGRGVTVNALAACNPQGRFYAADFNPAHVAGARQLAGNAGLSNLTLLESSFAELAAGKVADLPQFDFITLHGIYTWVTSENRQAIVQFLSRYLKPGGVVYLSYNAMPGWSNALPLQRLLVEHADLHPDRSDTQIKGGGEYIEKLSAAGANFFAQNPGLKSRLDMLKNGNRNYLVHEYMHKHWEPMYHVDVARDLAAAKLDYVGSADLPFAYPALFLSPDKQALINEVSDANLRETIKDYFLNTGFRKDIFVRGARRMSPARQRELLSQVSLALTTPRQSVSLKMKLGIGEVDGKPEIYNPLLDAVAARPQSIAELMALPELKGQSPNGLAQVMAFLTAAGQAMVYFGGGKAQEADSALRMNRALANEARYGDDYHVLTSPLLGSGINSNLVERITYLLMLEAKQSVTVEELARAALPVLLGSGRRLTKEGKTLTTDEENLRELGVQVESILATKLPIWRQLKMI